MIIKKNIESIHDFPILSAAARFVVETIDNEGKDEEMIQLLGEVFPNGLTEEELDYFLDSKWQFIFDKLSIEYSV